MTRNFKRANLGKCAWALKGAEQQSTLIIGILAVQI